MRVGVLARWSKVRSRQLIALKGCERECGINRIAIQGYVVVSFADPASSRASEKGGP